MVSVMPLTGSDLNGPPLRVARGTGQHPPVPFHPHPGYPFQPATPNASGVAAWGYGYGQVLGSSGSSCHSTSSTEDSRVPNAAESSSGVVTRGKAMSNGCPKVAPQKTMSRGKGKGKRMETKSVGKRAPSVGKGKGGKGRPAAVTAPAPKPARSRGKNINNLPKTSAASYADPPSSVTGSRGKMMPPPPAPPVVQSAPHPVADWHRDHVPFVGHHHHHHHHPHLQLQGRSENTPHLQHQQYYLRRRPPPQRSVFDPSKGDGGPPKVRSFGPSASSAGQSLFVDCSVEYELPTLRDAPGEDNREPLLIIHPGWQHQQRITRSRSQQRLLEQRRWFRHQQLAMLQQQQFAAQQPRHPPLPELYPQQFCPPAAPPPPCYPQPQPQQYQPPVYHPQSGPAQYAHPCCPPQSVANVKTAPSTAAMAAAAAAANSRKRTFDQVTFSMAPSCQMGYGGIMSDQHPIVRRANPSMSSNLALGPTATKRAKVQSEQPKRTVCSCGLVLDNVNRRWPTNCPAQPHLQTQPSPPKAMWNGMQLRSHPSVTTATVTSGSNVVANTGGGAAALARWNGPPQNLPGYYNHPHPHMQPVFNNNSCPCCPNMTCVRYRSV